MKLPQLEQEIINHTTLSEWRIAATLYTRSELSRLETVTWKYNHQPQPKGATMADTRNKSTKARMLRMAVTALFTASLTTAAFAQQISVTCEDGSSYSLEVECASGTPYAGCACYGWSSSTGVYDCGHLWTACVGGGGE